MTEENFERFLKKTAEGYNRPPSRVPRDEMWTAIQAKRGHGPRVVHDGRSAIGGISRRRFGSPVWLGAIAAALLLVATGVGIGRWSASPNPRAKVAANLPPRPLGVDTHGQTDNIGSGNGTPSTGNPSANHASEVPSPPGAVSISRPTHNTDGQTNPTRVASNGSPLSSSPAPAYQLTAVRHLSEAEALLTSFRARSTSDQQMDAQLGAWARQLLSNTRLLLDSPVANDPLRRPLLEDLELVLVEIVQLSPGSTSQDRDLIEKSLQQDHVMTRLRTAIPAGSERGG